MGSSEASALTLALCMPSLNELVHRQGLKSRPVQTPPTYARAGGGTWTCLTISFLHINCLPGFPSRLRDVLTKKLNISQVKYITSKPASTCNQYSFQVPCGYLNHRGLKLKESPFIYPLFLLPEGINPVHSWLAVSLTLHLFSLLPPQCDCLISIQCYFHIPIPGHTLSRLSSRKVNFSCTSETSVVMSTVL